ncbi:MAG: ABC transporter ATP-binding protein [Solobacterium sp.]|nr:ABC transporter ATP-binding protein [Solobacterium sp.]
MNNILEVKNLSFSYTDNSGRNRMILEDVSLGFEEGKFYSILGDSGSGKTTFLSLLSGLEYPDSGKIIYKSYDIKDIGYSDFRKKYVSIVFQDYNLIRYLSVYDNIVTAMKISGRKVHREEVLGFLKTLGIDEEMAFKKVTRLSGGEQQRVAIARAVAVNSSLILADEPTGNLDHSTSIEIFGLFKRLAGEYNRTVIMVTHNEKLAMMCDKVLYMDQNIRKLVNYECS